MDTNHLRTREKWEGGYVRNGKFIIERKIAGKKYELSTRCTTRRAALKHLERFEADPTSYDPNETDTEIPLQLDEALIDEFYVWHLGKKGTAKWSNILRSKLEAWANHFAGKDLRRLDLIDHVKPHLRGATTPHHRVKAIKMLFKWLRQEKGLIKRAEDVTLDLPVPTIKAAQQTGEAKAVPWAHVKAVVPYLPAHVADVLEFLAVTGWHVEEVRRFAINGLIRDRRASDGPNVVAVVGTLQKNGSKHFTALTHEQTLATAQRIKGRGKVIDNGRLRKHMIRAAAKARDENEKPVPVFQLGSIRHSVATWLVQDGVSLVEVSRYLGHRSVVTTSKFYVDHNAAAAAMPLSTLRLVR